MAIANTNSNRTKRTLSYLIFFFQGPSVKEESETDENASVSSLVSNINRHNVDDLDIDAVVEAGLMTDQVREHIMEVKRKPPLEVDLVSLFLGKGKS